MCGFLRGKPNAVQWPGKDGQEIRVQSTSIANQLIDGECSESRLTRYVRLQTAAKTIRDLIICE